MNTKSLIRHLLTALGAALILLGLGKYAGVVDFTLVNFDGIWQAGSILFGIATTIYGYFKGRTPEPITPVKTSIKS